MKRILNLVYIGMFAAFFIETVRRVFTLGSPQLQGIVGIGLMFVLMAAIFIRLLPPRWKARYSRDQGFPPQE